MLNPEGIERPYSQDIILSSHGGGQIIDQGSFGLKVELNQYGTVLMIAARRSMRVLSQRVIDENGPEPIKPLRHGTDGVGIVNFSFLRDRKKGTIYIGNGFEYRIQYLPDGKRDYDHEYPFNIESTQPISPLIPVHRLDDLGSALRIAIHRSHMFRK